MIADNCEDDTASLARSAGAVVVERNDPSSRGKGQALDWFFKTHGEIYGRYHAVAIMDADTLAHPDFLSEISLILSSPHVKVMQGYYGVSIQRITGALRCLPLPSMCFTTFVLPGETVLAVRLA